VSEQPGSMPLEVPGNATPRSSGASTHIIKCKCLRCSLHFIAFSFKDDWKPEFCPECGGREAFIIWRDTSNRFIFEFVPGKTGISMMSYFFGPTEDEDE
jgi:hypothetical protein